MNPSELPKRKRNPKETANLLSTLTFSYTASLFKKGYTRDLDDGDLYEVLTPCSAQRCGRKLEQQWKIEQKLDSSIYKLLWHRFGWRYLFVGCIDLIYKVVFSVFLPDVTSNLIAYFKHGQTEFTKYDAYYNASVVMILILVSCIYTHNYVLWIQQFAIEIRTAFSSLLYRKALRLTPSAMSKISLGNIVTLITKDVFTFQDSIMTINDTWNGLVQTCIICYLLNSKIGPVSFIGIGILLSALPIQIIIGKYISQIRLATGKKTDQRLQITQETLSTIRIIKMYTWEKFFGDRISAARRSEMNKILIGFYLRVVIVLIGILFARVGFFTLIISYIWMGYSTNTELIFYILTIFTDLEYNLGILIPYGVGKAAELYSSIIRINRVISAEEMPLKVGSDEKTTNSFIEITNATVHIKDHKVLENISLKTHKGLTIVSGEVGSGKSSLLKTLLQDYPLTSGKLKSQGRISYASQDPWLFPSTIRQNILFGQKYNEKKYQEVIRVCALQYDFSLLKEGDQTIVADRGLNLSKGQQARVNLARAIYRDCEIYLLDDSLTALDPQVQDFIFEECIQNFLGDKICILVTQTSHHIQLADIVIIMQEGRIKTCGKPNEQIIKEINEIVVRDDDLDKEIIEEKEMVKNGVKDLEPDDHSKDSEQEPLNTDHISKQAVYGEIKKQGEVDYEIYKKYFAYGGGILFMILNIIIFGLAQASESYTSQLLTQWVDEKELVLEIQRNLTNKNLNATPISNVTLNSSSLTQAEAQEQFTITLYSVMVFVATGSALLKMLSLLFYCRNASINIHKAMLSSLMNGVMSFFDTHFIGNILNRFSQDMNNIDEILPFVFTEFFRVLFAVSGIVYLLTTVNWIFLLYFCIFFALLILLRKFYMPTGRSLKRLEAASRSPMIGHLNASLEGLTTIRACKVEHVLIEEFDKHQDLFTSAHYISLATTRAFSFTMDFLCSLFIISVVARFTFGDTDISVGDIGLAITQVFMLSGDVDWGIKQWADLENLMTSVERLVEYTEIKSENKDGNSMDNWPEHGTVNYSNVSLSYNKKETVLKNLSFELSAGKNVGIVGRTGAGKSSIISSMFRLYDVEGQILIDGVDIRTLSLSFLRKKLAIIPQDPILFSGTIRTNLDPFEEFEDKELWRALERVNLTNLITSLETKTSNSQSTFSSGQKQLICLARAILRKAKIVILDEATANMDQETDVLLNNTIKENFSNCTMLTIAHRLHSILECDSVMVLDRGEIKEFDSPNNLLSNKGGHFYKMVQQAGLISYLD